MLLLALIVGICAALLGRRWGAYLAVGSITIRFYAYLIGALWAYHKTMSRPWPKVAPLDDDDDDW